MKPNPDHDPLLNEVFAGGNLDGFRRASLERTLSAARRHRRWRRAVRGGSALAVCATLAVVLWHERKPSVQPVAVGNLQNPSPVQLSIQTVPGTNIRLVNDEELLAMFPNRPVALIGPPEDRRFVLLDEPRVSKSRPPSQGKSLNL